MQKDNVRRGWASLFWFDFIYCCIFVTVEIIGSMEVTCASFMEVMQTLEQGSTYRHTASTRMNDHSSRSHSIFTVIVGQYFIVIVVQYFTVIVGQYFIVIVGQYFLLLSTSI